MPSPRWQPGESGNPTGRKPGSRNRLSEEVISSFLRDWRKHGDKALERLRRNRLDVYCKLAVMLVPREHKIEHSTIISGLTDDQLNAYLADIQDRIDRKAGKQVKVIEGTVEPTAVETPAPTAELEPPKCRSNRLMTEADTAIGPRERTPRKRKVPSPSDADGVP